MDAPYVFVSHKHADTDIALRIANALHSAAAGQVEIHLSSNPQFEGPRLGSDLNQELKAALARAHLVLLVFTDESQDWSYCMWECGVATDPTDARRTGVVVVQCGAQAPAVYGATMRVDLTSKVAVTDFMTQFCTRPDFFPGLGRPITGYAKGDANIERHVDWLFTEVQPLLARLSDQRERHVTSPFVRVELPAEAVRRIREAPPDREVEEAVPVLLDEARIDQSQLIELLFDVAVGPETRLRTLVGDEIDDAGRAPAWFTSVAAQVVAALQLKLHTVAWTPMDADGARLYVPFVAVYRRSGSESPVQLDLFFIRLQRPTVRASERMLGIQDAWTVHLGETDPAALTLRSVIESGRSRMPVLDELGRPLMIVHRSMIMEFVGRQSFTGGDTNALTLQDLLGDPSLKELFVSSFATVPPSADLDDVRTTMTGIPNCQDVFVTEDGSRDSPALGWLTNVMFIQG